MDGGYAGSTSSDRFVGGGDGGGVTVAPNSDGAGGDVRRDAALAGAGALPVNARRGCEGRPPSF